MQQIINRNNVKSIYVRLLEFIFGLVATVAVCFPRNRHKFYFRHLFANKIMPHTHATKLAKHDFPVCLTLPG